MNQTIVYEQGLDQQPSMLITTLLVFLLLLLPFSPAMADRKVILEKDGITVETELHSGRIFPLMIGRTKMESSVQQISQWLRAVHTYVDWQHNCIEAKALTLSDGTIAAYNRVKSPWPVSDRDVIMLSSVKALDGGGLLMEFNNIEDDSVKVPKGVVRMVHLSGSYRLTPSLDGGTDVVYTLDSDPGGKIPTWLVKQASKDMPYNTLKNLRERAESGLPPEI